MSKKRKQCDDCQQIRTTFSVWIHMLMLQTHCTGMSNAYR